MPSFARRHLRVLVVAAALLAALAGAGLWFRTSSFVRVNAVTVTGIEGRQAAQIRDALTVAGLGMSTLDVDTAALRAAVSGYPVVRDLRTSTGFPHRLRIDVNALVPVAALHAGGDIIAVAADGTLLRGSSIAGLPVVGAANSPRGDRVGDAATRDAIRLVAATPAALRSRLSHVYRDHRGLAATVENGPRLYFGGGERLRAKWFAAAAVLADGGARGASYVDLRIPERPVAGGFQPQPPGV